MILCSRGHIYDNTRFTSCPYCNGGVLKQTSPVRISAETDSFIGESAKTADFTPEPTAPEAEQSVPVTAEVGAPESNEEKAPLPPVTGWLVCITGEHRGEDFRLSGERNSVGTLGTNEVCLVFDTSIAAEGEAYINFDEKSGCFFIVEGNGKNNLRVNGEIVLGHMQVRDFDVIEVGKTKLIFRSLCGEAFAW